MLRDFSFDTDVSAESFHNAPDNIYTEITESHTEWVAETATGASEYLTQLANTLVRDPGADTNGPEPPNVLKWEGKPYEIPPIQWRLLNHMWSRSQASEEDVVEQVWSNG